MNKDKNISKYSKICIALIAIIGNYYILFVDPMSWNGSTGFSVYTLVMSFIVASAICINVFYLCYIIYFLLSLDKKSW